MRNMHSAKCVQILVWYCQWTKENQWFILVNRTDNNTATESERERESIGWESNLFLPGWAVASEDKESIDSHTQLEL